MEVQKAGKLDEMKEAKLEFLKDDDSDDLMVVRKACGKAVWKVVKRVVGKAGWRVA